VVPIDHFFSKKSGSTTQGKKEEGKKRKKKGKKGREVDRAGVFRITHLFLYGKGRWSPGFTRKGKRGRKELSTPNFGVLTLSLWKRTNSATLVGKKKKKEEKKVVYP